MNEQQQLIITARLSQQPLIRI